MHRSARARTRLLLALALASVAVLAGCAFGEIRWKDPLQRELTLEEAQERYTLFVRWSEFEKASAFVDPERREDFLAQLPSFRELRFTDYESERLRFGEEGGTTVSVTYFAYTPTSPLVVTIHETQEWYREPGVGNHWRVRPAFRGLDAFVAKPAPAAPATDAD